MRIVIQRVKEASVKIDDQISGEIKNGMLIFVGVEDSDNKDDINWLVKKIIALRIFNDADGKMNLSVEDVDGDILVVSQFTLHASTKKGNRPSYIKAAHPTIAIPLYENFIDELGKASKKKIATGEFGADMKVSLINDGPVTLIIDSKNRE